MDCKSIVCDANNLYDAYEKTVKGSKWKETTQKFALNYLRKIFEIQDELYNQTYKPGQEGHFILHERGKVRPITTLGPKDRVIRHVLCDNVLLPAIKPKIIYDNYASIKHRGVSMARKRFEAHLHKFYSRTGNNQGYILFGDFRKFYDNIIHSISKEQFLTLLDYDPYLKWLLDVVFSNFKVDVSYLSEEEFNECMDTVFDRLEYYKIPKRMKTKEKLMDKSVNIGDQLSQLIGIYYPNRIDTYVKYVRQIKEYGRYMDDFYIMSESKEELKQLMREITIIASKLEIHMNDKKTKIIRMDQSYKYLQVTYHMTKTGHIIKKISHKRLNDMKRRLKKLAVLVKEGKTNYICVEQVFLSWTGNYYKLMSKKQRKSLISLYEDLFNKRIIFSKHSGKRKMIILTKRRR